MLGKIGYSILGAIMGMPIGMFVGFWVAILIMGVEYIITGQTTSISFEPLVHSCIRIAGGLGVITGVILGPIISED